MAWVHKNRTGIPAPKPLARTFSSRVIKPWDRPVDAVYRTPMYLAWQLFVIGRAGKRCEALDDGIRCRKAAPEHRMFADHKKELQDGGSPFDPANGQCLCGSHHTIKTMHERARRMGKRG